LALLSMEPTVRRASLRDAVCPSCAFPLSQRIFVWFSHLQRRFICCYRISLLFISILDAVLRFSGSLYTGMLNSPFTPLSPAPLDTVVRFASHATLSLMVAAAVSTMIKMRYSAFVSNSCRAGSTCRHASRTSSCTRLRSCRRATGVLHTPFIPAPHMRPRVQPSMRVHAAVTLHSVLRRTRCVFPRSCLRAQSGCILHWQEVRPYIVQSHLLRFSIPIIAAAFLRASACCFLRCILQHFGGYP
jgi:hypothetical protein